MTTSIDAVTTGAGGLKHTGDASGVLELKSGGVTKLTIGPNGPTYPGAVLQVVHYRTGAVATGTTQTPYDDTIPQNTEGDQYLSLSITPKSAASYLVIETTVYLSNNNSNSTMQMALFQDSTASALAAGVAYPAVTINTLQVMTLDHYMLAGTTSATTFKVRLGANQASTTTLNGTAGARLMGGIMSSSITITEIAT